ncbi:MAG: nucleotide exchange factor GrpE [Deltaproteobacteria bacterium]|nr:nucleotide exchange factor GrpE [Deltaproteobacteria bacterium]
MNTEPNEHDALTSQEAEQVAERAAEPTPEQAAPEKDARAEAAPEAPPQAPYSDPRDLRIQLLERTLAEREATLHTYIRAHKKAEADFEAFRQRMNRDKDKEVEAAAGRLVEKLLDIDDNLERTLQAAEAQRAASPAVEGIITGVRLVHRMFLERLGELGLQRLDPTGQTFDPTSMEALGITPVDDPAKDGKVVITLRPGFRLGSRELKPALVQVGRLMT